MPLRTLALTALAAFALTATAQAQTPTCEAVDDSRLPETLSAWTHRAPARASAGAPGTSLRLGAAIDAQLSPVADVAFPVAPARPASPGTYGGLLSLRIEKAGDYRIALGGPAWVDVIRDGVSVTSTGHGHGPGCSSVRKIVAFALKEGAYVIEIAGSPTPTIAVLATR